MFSAFLTKTVLYFLFVSLDDKALQKWGVLLEKKKHKQTNKKKTKKKKKKQKFVNSVNILPTVKFFDSLTINEQI